MLDDLRHLPRPPRHYDEGIACCALALLLLLAFFFN